MINFILILIFIPIISFGSNNIYINCIKFKDIIKESSYKVIEKDFPYWYNIGLIFTESNCKWVYGKDKHGSIGYSQIIPSVWDRYLLRYYPKYKVKDHPHHFYGFSFILKTYKNTLDKHKLCKDKLWVLYQMYNGGYLILKECNKSNSCEWNKCKQFCNRKSDCINYDKNTNTCKQYKSLCDINYQYSQKIYKYGNEIKLIIKEMIKDSKSFW